MITLPHTGLRVPHNRLGCDAFTPILEPDGIAFTVTLTLDGHSAGTITDHGTGGATIYLPGASGLFSHHDLAAFAAACRTQGGRTPDVENVLVLLTEEHIVDAMLTEAQRDATTLVRHTHPITDEAGPDGDRAGETYICDIHQLDLEMAYRTPAEREHLAHVLNRATTCDNPAWQIWHEHAWTPLLTTN